MRTWASRIGAVVRLLDPDEQPRQILERMWCEVETWQIVSGIWLRCWPGRLQPGAFCAGRIGNDIIDLAKLAGAYAIPVGSGSGAIAREVRDGSTPVASLLVAHQDAPDVATLLVDLLARYCVERLRRQREVGERCEETGQQTTVAIDQQWSLQASLERHAERHGPDLESCFRQAERILIVYALNQARGVKLRAARSLGINRVTLDRKLVEYGVQVKRGRGVLEQASAGTA